jgi:cation transport regulator ChaB
MPTEDLPGTLQRSPEKAQRTYEKTLDSAHETYDDEAAAHRVAFAALKHSFEKVGDHWEEKDEKGPSDPQAARGGAEARDDPQPTGGGKKVGATRKELYAEAKRLNVSGRSKMSTEQLTEAVRKAKK